jgi:NitT/TauT family transport system ATP-binding protein
MMREPPAVLTPAEPAVEVLSAHKTYPDGTAALQPVDLKIGQGEFVTLLGPSGCGKSTLLKMIAGLLEPSDGRLLLWRKPVAQLEQTGKRMAFVFQAPTLMPWASVQANVRLPLDLAGVPRAEAEARVADALALVGLAQFAKALPRNLSGGMQMRVSIARSLVVQPQLLLTSHSARWTRSRGTSSTPTCCACGRTRSSPWCSSPTLSTKPCFFPTAW